MTIYEDVLIKGMLAQIVKVKDSEALSATVIMIYVAIDTMGFLSMPAEKEKNGSVDFIEWVDKYLKTDSSQPYQYMGKDMWGARCAKLHSYSSDSEYAQRNNCKLYGYHNGSDHLYAPKESEKLVLISVYRLFNDFCGALASFLEAASKNTDLKVLIDQRLERVCQQFDIKDRFSTNE